MPTPSLSSFIAECECKQCDLSRCRSSCSDAPYVPSVGATMMTEFISCNHEVTASLHTAKPAHEALSHPSVERNVRQQGQRAASGLKGLRTAFAENCHYPVIFTGNPGMVIVVVSDKFMLAPISRLCPTVPVT